MHIFFFFIFMYVYAWQQNWDFTGDWTLDINPVTLEDDARFQCQIGAAEAGIAPIRSRYATLSVLVPPNPPKMLGGSGQMADGQTIHKTVEGRQVELRCESRGGKPAAEVRQNNVYQSLLERIFITYFDIPNILDLDNYAILRISNAARYAIITSSREIRRLSFKHAYFNWYIRSDMMLEYAFRVHHTYVAVRTARKTLSEVFVPKCAFDIW